MMIRKPAFSFKEWKNANNAFLSPLSFLCNGISIGSVNFVRDSVGVRKIGRDHRKGDYNVLFSL